MGRSEVIQVVREMFDSADELPEDERALLEAARKAAETAYSPYSGFNVGAAVLTTTGRIIAGHNVENSAYGSTICAERAALLAADTAGEGGGIRKMAVFGTGKKFDTTQPVGPCGDCRQVTREIEDRSGEPIVIVMAGQRGEIARVVGIANLLPWGFGPKDIDKENVPQ